MAFNPFHRFRKHQRAFLAVLAILCMFIFVFQFGRGDLFDRAMRWFGLRETKGTVVATLYGEKVREADLGELSRQRRLANDFLVGNGFLPGAIETGFEKVEQEIEGSLKGVDQVQRLVTAYFQWKKTGQGSPEILLRDLDQLLTTRPDGDQGARAIPPSQLTPPVLAKINEFRALLRFHAWQEARMNMIRAYQQTAARAPHQLSEAVLPDYFLFGGNNNVRDLLDFKLWLHEADRLGITLTESQVRQAINREAAEKAVIRDSFSSDKFVHEFLTRYAAMQQSRQARPTPEQLYTAVANEFRVLMAKEALLGEQPGPRSARAATTLSPLEMPSLPGMAVSEPAVVSPADATPEEFFDYYLKMTSTANFGVLAINVQDYLSKVDAKPKESELEALFQKFKDREPVPEQGIVGFKEPPRAEVEWVYANPDRPDYKTRARAILMHQAVLQRTVSVAPAPGAGSIPWAVTAGIALATPDPLERQYQSYKLQETGGGLHPWLGDTATRLHEVSVVRPGTIAFGTGQVGMIGGLLGTGPGAALAPVVTFAGTAGVYEKAEKERILASYIAAGVLARAPDFLVSGRKAIPSVFGLRADRLTRVAPLPVLALGVAPALQIIPYPLPVLSREQVQERFLAQLEKDLQRSEMRKDLDELEKLLTEAKTDPKKRGRVDDFIRKLGFEHAAMKEPRSRFDIAGAPALKPFHDAFLKEYESDPLRELRFADLVLTGRDRLGLAELFAGFDRRAPAAQEPGREAAVLRSLQPMDLYTPSSWSPEARAIPDETKLTGQYFFWLTDRVSPRVPNALVEVRPQVEKAWRLQLARELARKDADRLLADLKKQSMAGEAAAKYLEQRANQDARRYFTLDGVARLVPDSNVPRAIFAPRYKRYTVPQTLILYQPRNLVDLLMRVEKPGEALTFGDLPEEHFYVAVQVQRTPNLEDTAARKEALREFVRVYAQAASGIGTNVLWKSHLMPDLRKQYQNKVLHQLRLDAAGPDGVDAAGNLKLPRDAKLPDERRGGDED